MAPTTSLDRVVTSLHMRTLVLQELIHISPSYYISDTVFFISVEEIGIYYSKRERYLDIIMSLVYVCIKRSAKNKYMNFNIFISQVFRHISLSNIPSIHPHR